MCDHCDKLSIKLAEELYTESLLVLVISGLIVSSGSNEEVVIQLTEIFTIGPTHWRGLFLHYCSFGWALDV